jgi:hypothetical protein
MVVERRPRRPELGDSYGTLRRIVILDFYPF